MEKLKPYVLQFFKAIGKRARLTGALVVILAGMGTWTHQVYAARLQAELTARQEAVTLNDVMAKLNRLEEKMNEMGIAARERAKFEDVEFKSLAYEHSRLAALQLRERAVAPQIQQVQAVIQSPISIENELCFKGALNGKADFGIDGKIAGKATAEVGLDAFGDGVKAGLDGDLGASLGLGVGGELGAELSSCVKFDQFNQTVSSDVNNMIKTVGAGASTVANRLGQLYANHPNLQPAAIVSALDALDSLNVAPSPTDVLQRLENPANAFQSVGGLVNALPLPGNLQTFLTNPAAMFPTPNNLDVQAICSAVAVQGGPLSNICTKIPANLVNLPAIQNVVNGVANVQTDIQDITNRVANVEVGLHNACGSVDGTIGQIDNTVLRFGGDHLATIGFISIDTPAVVIQPFHFPLIPCP